METITFNGPPPIVADDHGNSDGRLLQDSTPVPKDTRPPYQLRDNAGLRLACFTDPRTCVDTAVSVLRTPLTVMYYGAPIARTNRRKGETRADTQVRVLRDVVAAAVQRNRDLADYRERIMTLSEEYMS